MNFSVGTIAILLLLFIGWPTLSEAVVSYSSTGSVTPTTGSSTNLSITVPATNPALGVCVAMASSTATITAATWTPNGGSPQNLTTVANAQSTDAYISALAVAAPVSGAGTVAITLSASVPYQVAASTFTGAHQSNLAGADAQTSVSSATSVALTPTNLVSGDASFGCGALTVSGNPTGVTPNQRYLNNITPVNLQMGDATNTTGVTFAWDNSSGNHAMVTTRIPQASADVTPPTDPSNLVVTATGSSTTALTWTASTDDVGIANYRVERCSGVACSPVTEIGTPATNSFNNSGLTKNTLYRYRVRAYDGTNFSGYSSTEQATTLNTQQATLTWNDTNSTPNNEEGYVVQRKTGAGGTYANLTTTAANATGYVDTDSPTSTVGSSACYQVRATATGFADSSYSNEVCTGSSGATGVSAIGIVAVGLTFR